VRVDSGEQESMTSQKAASQSHGKNISSGNRGKKGGSDSGDGSSEIIQQTVAEDPIAKFLQTNWRIITTVVILGFAFVYGKSFFEQTRHESLRRSADVLLNLQEQVEQLSTFDSTAVADETKEDQFEQGLSRARELTRALSQERAPYASLAPMYTALLSQIQLSKAGGGNELGADLTPQSLSETELVLQKEEGVVVELQNFHRALYSLNVATRSATDSASSDAEPALLKLKELVRTGDFVGGAALAVLQAFASDDQQMQDELRVLAKEYLVRNPEQAEVLRRELPALYE